ncbi:AAA family ATPase [Chloroflexota bacterium]
MDENPDKLKLLVQFTKPDVVVIDSFSAIHYKEENSAMEMRPILDRLRGITEMFGITMICIHHFARTYESGKRGHLRGSTVIEAQSDFALGMHKSQTQLFLSPLKARGVFEPINLAFDKQTLTYDAFGTLTKGNKKIARQHKILTLQKQDIAEGGIIAIITEEYRCTKKTVQRDLSELAQLVGQN